MCLFYTAKCTNFCILVISTVLFIFQTTASTLAAEIEPHGGGGGNFVYERVEMLVGKFELNP